MKTVYIYTGVPVASLYLKSESETTVDSPDRNKNIQCLSDRKCGKLANFKSYKKIPIKALLK